MFLRFAGLLAVLSLLLISPSMPIDGQSVECATPLDEWQTAAPEDVGINADLLTEGESQIEMEMPFLRSLLIVRRGCLVYERYFGGADKGTRFNGFSITKSVTGTLIGMSIEEGLIESVNDPLADYLELSEDDAHRRIRITHLLHMLSGIDWDETSAADIGGMLTAQRDEIGYILSLPQAHIPGTYWNYSTADSHLLSAVLSAAAGESTAEFAQAHLFDPLAISSVEWATDSAGINFGGTQLFWRARDMAKFGQLYLQNGEWNAEQVVPSAWIAYLTRPQLADPSIYELSYAAHWWHTRLGDFPPMSAASGYGGQLIFVAPDQDMVIVITANGYRIEPDSYISGVQEARQREAILDYVEQFILPAVETD